MRPPFPPYVQAEFREERQTAETIEKGHGRIEQRRLVTSTALNDYLDWPGVQQVCQLTRTTQRDGRQSTDVQYALSSVPPQRADAYQLLTWWRRLWHIENRVHYVRDVTMAEDACRVRTGSAPQVLSGVRNAAINLLRALGIDNIAEATREFAWKPQRLSVILSKRNN